MKTDFLVLSGSPITRQLLDAPTWKIGYQSWFSSWREYLVFIPLLIPSVRVHDQTVLSNIMLEEYVLNTIWLPLSTSQLNTYKKVYII